MLVLIPFFLQAFFLLHVYGTVAFILTKTKLPINPFVPLMFGFPILGVLSLFFVLGGPINNFSYFVIVFGAIISIWRYQFYFHMQWLNFKSWLQAQEKFSLWVLLGLLLVILYQSALPSKINDMFMYYMQTLFWMEEYGTVKGLGNLHPAFGLSSTWHSLLVLIGEHGFLAKALNTRFYGINGVLLVSLLLFVYAELRIERNRMIILAFFTLSIVLGFVYLTAPSPDFPVLVFVPFLFYHLLKLEWGLFTQNEQVNNFNPVLYAILGSFIFTLKPPAFLVVCLLFFFGLNLLRKALKGNYKLLFQFTLTLGIVLLPLLYRNYIQTGYPLYPSGITIPEKIIPSNPSSLAFITSDSSAITRKPFWKLPTEWNESFRKGVQTWGYSDRLDKKVFKAPQPNKHDRLILWLLRPGYKGFMNKILFLNFIFGMVLFFLSILKRKKIGFIEVASTAFILISVLEWLYLSQYRLMLPTAICFLGWNILMSTVRTPIIEAKLFAISGKPNFINLTYLLVLGYFMVFAFVPFSIWRNQSRNKNITQMDGFTSKYLFKPSIDYAKTQPKTFQVDSIQFYYYSDQVYSSDCPIPSISLSHRKFLASTYHYKHRAVASKIEEGFFLEKIENQADSVLNLGESSIRFAH